MWIGALVQFAIAVPFILLLRLPRFLIIFFGLFSLLAVLLGIISTRKPISPRPSPQGPAPQGQKPAPQSSLYWIVSLAIALCGLVFFACLLFGSVAFIDSWNDWHRYEGQPFHRAEFIVQHDYYQKYSKSADLYASGLVDGQREWMDLKPYLQSQNPDCRPRGREELELCVPPGTSIPIYLFPDLKGRLRVPLYSETLPAEAYRRTAMNAAKYGLGGMAVSGLAIFLLIRIRAGCFQQPSPAISWETQV